MSLATVIFFAIYIYLLLLKDKRKKLLYAMFYHTIISIFVTIGNVIEVGPINITFTDASLLILIIIYFNYIRVHKFQINRLSLNQVLILILCIILGWVFNTLGIRDIMTVPMGKFWTIGALQVPRFSISYLAYFIRLLFFVMVLQTIKAIMTLTEIAYFRKIFIFFGKICLLFGAIEFLTKMYAPHIFNTYIKLLFVDTTNYFINSRGGIFPILGLCFEPSMFVWSNFFLGVVLIKSNDRRNHIWLLLLLFEIFISMSFSSLLISVILVIYALYSFDLERRVKILVVLLIVISFVVLNVDSSAMQYYMDRIMKVNISLNSNKFNDNIGSEIRIQSIIYTLSQFIQAPLFGTGLGSAYAYSCIVTFLTSCGLTTVIVYIYIVRNFCIHWCKIAIVSVVVVIIPLFFLGSIADIYTFTLPLTIVLLNFKESKEFIDGRDNNFKLSNL